MIINLTSLENECRFCGQCYTNMISSSLFVFPGALYFTLLPPFKEKVKTLTLQLVPKEEFFWMEISQDPWYLGLLWKPHQLVCCHHWIYSYTVSLIHVLYHIWRSPTEQSWSGGSQTLLTIKHPTLLQRVWSQMLSLLWSRWSGNATRGTLSYNLSYPVIHTLNYQLFCPLTYRFSPALDEMWSRT